MKKEKRSPIFSQLQSQKKEAEADMELASEEMEQYQKLADTGAIAGLQIEQKEQAFQRAREQLRQAEIELGKTAIRAPADGTIYQLELRNSDQAVTPGEPIAKIAPSNASMVIKARVPAQDISKIEVCQAKKVSACEKGKAQMRFSAYPYPDYGTLKGAVTAIAPDATSSQASDDANPSAAPPYYEVQIQPEKTYFVKSDQHHPIQPGMEATADVTSREETVLTFLLRKARLLADV